jgi:glycine dehydrogenase
MMIEPTESEDVRELDRFLSAMESIRSEIAEIESGKISIEDSPLRHAPHTMGDLIRDDWNRKYSRQIAAFPSGEGVGIGRAGKYLPTVGRIDGVFGDRNLVCSCLPIEELASN